MFHEFRSIEKKQPQSIKTDRDSIKTIWNKFDQSKIFKFERESLCLFRSIETRESGFLKRQIGLFQSHFFKLFKLSSLSSTWLGSTMDFLSFSSKFFARFLSLKAGKSLLPFLLHFISWFHAFFMHYYGYFRHFQNIGVFDVSNLFLWNWSMGFCPRML